MSLEIKELSKKDHKKAIQFAIKGMHFDWYTDNKILLNAYGRYFWYLELLRATEIIAVYVKDEFAGVLLAKMKGETRKYYSFWNVLYVKMFDILQNIFVKDGAGVYETTNREMFLQYNQKHVLDGEILFLASNPEIQVKGIGTTLLKEFEYRQKGKRVFLYTDNACTYQFYEHRGFECIGKKDILVKIGDKKVDLQCLLYSKVIDK